MRAAAKLRLHRETMTAAGITGAAYDDAVAKSFVTRHVIVGESEQLAWDRAEALVGKAPMMDRSQDDRSLRELSTAPIDLTAMHEARNRNAAFVQSWVIAGTPDSVTEQILAYERLGIGHLNTRFTVGTYQPEHIHASFHLFTKEVLPSLSPRHFQEAAR
ncbi:MAG: LLM class flavin-dependent oxidoreductase [Nonomuraea sp.]|nr:LLM class flavin-dependent oxidoreductase [Nonomuraea sp.]